MRFNVLKVVIPEEIIFGASSLDFSRSGIFGVKLGVEGHREREKWRGGGGKREGRAQGLIGG